MKAQRRERMSQPCMREAAKAYAKTYRKENPELTGASSSRSKTAYRQNLRHRVLDMYDRKCNRCGYNDNILALQLDHVNGNGAEERRKLGSQWCVYERALQPEHRTEYQILCANCNSIKRVENKEYKRKYQS